MPDELDPRDVDEALVIATRRTTDAQAHVDRVVDEGRIPPLPAVDDVVHRAEDVTELAHDAAAQTDPKVR